jgi:phosphoribosylaminoimidazole-succinocarboxamide synthase
MEKIAEGKTKIIWAILGIEDEVIIESKAVLTAGDGAKRDFIEGKEIYATKTTCNCFRLLKAKGIPTHFIEKVDERRFKAVRLQMIPIELVARRVATGSYLKRYPEIREGTLLKELVIEFFLKDDARHDPLMVWDEEKSCFKLYQAKKPLNEGYLGELPRDYPFVPKTSNEVRYLEELTKRIFLILEKVWAEQNVTLVDLKIECGFDETGKILVGDVIDNDSWRIWPAGDKSQMKDKQVYRDLTEMTPETQERLRKNYAWVAEATEKFK